MSTLEDRLWDEHNDRIADDQAIPYQETHIPLDPADQDRIPPEDLNDCVACQGRAIILLTPFDPRDPASIDTTDCSRCGGTGQEPSR